MLQNQKVLQIFQIKFQDSSEQEQVQFIKTNLQSSQPQMGLVQSNTYPKFTQKYNKQNQKQYILMTYRSGIVPIEPTTYYTSDSGWGCMLRVAQMFIANLLFQKQNKKHIIDIVQLFYDNLMVPFSIQKMTKISKKIFPYMKNYEWYTPCQAGFLVKQMLQQFDTQYQVKICNDGAMFLQQLYWIQDLKSVKKQEKQFKLPKQSNSNNQNNHVSQSTKSENSFRNKQETKRNRIVVFLMARIGLQSPQVGYLKALQKIMENKYFFAVMGGRPRNAHLFMQHRQGYFGYLDPHTTYQTVSQISQLKENIDTYRSKLSWLKQNKIDSSMAIGFCLQKQQVKEFWNSLVELKNELKQNFFIYLDQKRPQIDQDALIQIGQFEF